MKTTPEMIEVMQQYCNGAEIEIAQREEWEFTPSPEWDWSNFDYRIKQPAKQKIKMLCYYNQDYASLYWISEYHKYVSDTSIRQPHLDMEAEV